MEKDKEVESVLEGKKNNRLKDQEKEEGAFLKLKKKEEKELGCI